MSTDDILLKVHESTDPNKPNATKYAETIAMGTTTFAYDCFNGIC